MNTFTLKAKLSSYRVQLGMDFLLYHRGATSCTGYRVTEPLLLKKRGEKEEINKIVGFI